MTRALVLLLLFLPLLAACSEDASEAARRDQPAERPALVAGSCWSDQQLPQALGESEFDRWAASYARGDEDLAEAMRDDAAFSEPVDCGQPHALELYDVVSVSASLDRRIKEYADLLDPSSRLYLAVREQVNQRCAAGSAYGKAARRAGVPVQLGPSLAPDSGLTVAWDPFPADLWTRGQRKFVCTFEQEEPGTLRFADLTTTKVPLAARVCLDTPGTFVSCRGPHQAEDIAEMVLNPAIAAGKIDAGRALRKGPKGRYVAFSDREYARLDKVCDTFLRMVSTRPHGVSGRAYPGSVEQWPTKSGAYLATCYALRPLDPPPKMRGSVFDRG